VECLVSLPLWGTRWVRVGCRAWALSPDAPQCEADTEVARLRSRGQIGVYVSVMDHQDGGKTSQRSVIAVLGIVDPPQAQAASTIAALQNMGLDVWMCTGDHESTALAVAQQVGIPADNVCAGVTPEGKSDLMTRLQKRKTLDTTFSSSSNNKNTFPLGKRGKGYSRIPRTRSTDTKVAFVGDGINDAVALARADVGIAIGAGTEVAVEAADMVLVKNSLHDVVVAMHLSGVVFKRIRLNFFFALMYNMFALPFAAGVFYSILDWTLPPAAAGLMMAFSSVSVVTSSLCLRTYSRPTITEEGQLQSTGLCCCGGGTTISNTSLSDEQVECMMEEMEDSNDSASTFFLL
jgi:Cu+-exporting ATPase